MRCTCWIRKRVEALLATALLLAGPAGAATLPCALEPPRVETAANALQIEIGVDCTPGAAEARDFPVGQGLLLGLTLYGPPRSAIEARNRNDNFSRRVVEARPEVVTALGRATESKAVLVAGAPRWSVLGDDDADAFDVAPQPLQAKAGSRTRLRFTVPLSAATGKNHLLFVVWNASARQPCEKTSKFARSGCRRDGFVLDGEPVAAYPGREINAFVHPSGEQWNSERWIVERFR